jgi:glycosyltransferase involved in cell wall biosynthesis
MITKREQIVVVAATGGPPLFSGEAMESAPVRNISSEKSTSTLLGVSIIIPNHNYARFVGEAIESALAQTHPLVEVIVVDDGSTDDSRPVIERYTSRVAAVFQANAGHLRACAAGFARSHCPIVMFLDSDDRLVPEAAAIVAEDWPTGVSKKQFRLQVFDRDSAPREHRFPKYPPGLTPSTVRAELLRTGYYTCPPGLGNVYARSFLERVWPFDEHRWTDAVLCTLAPLYGDVLTSEQVIAHYRIHGANFYHSGTEVAVTRFEAYIEEEGARIEILKRHCQRLRLAFDSQRALDNLLPFREFELVVAKLSASGSADRKGALYHAVGAVKAGLAHPQTPLNRAIRAAWALAVAVMPRPVATRLIAFRYLPSKRPRSVERFLEFFGGPHAAG